MKVLWENNGTSTINGRLFIAVFKYRRLSLEAHNLKKSSSSSSRCSRTAASIPQMEMASHMIFLLVRGFPGAPWGPLGPRTAWWKRHDELAQADLQGCNPMQQPDPQTELTGANFRGTYGVPKASRNMRNRYQTISIETYPDWPSAEFTRKLFKWKELCMWSTHESPNMTSLLVAGSCWSLVLSLCLQTTCKNLNTECRFHPNSWKTISW